MFARARDQTVCERSSKMDETMLDEMYNAKILDLAGRTPSPSRLSDPHQTAVRHSKLCGSKLTADVKFEGEEVAEIAMDVKACALGQAAAAVVYENAVGAKVDEVRRARAAMHGMLKGEGSVPEGRFQELRFLEPVRDYRARHASTLLAIDALAEACEAHAKANAA